ncbi:MAG: hypothetical protein K2X86_09215 [Cytophagaceae bacterium]|nr:hypothetical protein [Cytophagaceae bacterium]
MLRTVFILYTFLFSFHAYADSIEPVGRFLSDSAKLGQSIKYSLSVKHDAGLQILFPDSSFNYYPFELIAKEYYPTATNNNSSLDSAIFILRTFELEPAQSLALPVYVFSDNDSIAIYSKKDSIGLKEYISGIPSLLTIKEQTAYNKVPLEINYPYILFYLAVCLVIGFIIFFLFGKTIKRRYRLYKIRADHMHFIRNFQKALNNFSHSDKTLAIEQALTLWKSYLTRLENIPINTYTTTEIINLYNKEDLKHSLNIIDRAIYGGLITQEADKALSTLKRFSNRTYYKRKREILND